MTANNRPTGVVVLAFGPQPMTFFDTAQMAAGKTAVLDPDVARMAGATFAAGPRDALDALRQRLEAGALEAEARRAHPGLSEAAERWLASGKRGISSNTIFTVLTGVDALGGHRKDNPYDTSDLSRCRLLLEQVPELVPLFPKMAEVSPAWANLVRDWDTICRTMDEESPEWRDGRGYAFKTYQLIKAAIGR